MLLTSIPTRPRKVNRKLFKRVVSHAQAEKRIGADRCQLYGVTFAKRLLRCIGLERVLFGTDYPIFPRERYYEVLDQMRFTDDEIEQIAYRNAANVLRKGDNHDHQR